MAYYSYKRVRDILIASGEIIFDEDNILKPKNQSLYGERIDNTYLGNLYEMIADEYEKLQAENAELKVLNLTQENLLKACIKWMDSKGCPVPYDLRIALETPPEGG